MEKKQYIMALDQGTTSSRCILFDKKGNIISMAQKEFEQIYPKAGWVEHNPMEIWSSQLAVATEAMAKVGADASDIAALGITNQRETTIVWDKNTGLPVYNAICWQCHRTAGYGRGTGQGWIWGCNQSQDRTCTGMRISVERSWHGFWIMWKAPENVQRQVNYSLEPWIPGLSGILQRAGSL